MPRTLILFAHPSLEKSRVHSRLIEQIPDLPQITFHDLYEAYPDYDVDIVKEQRLLTDHDLIVLQHPMFWYSVPPLLKQWIDLVLAHGWAYGSEGTALRGKRVILSITTGGMEGAYQPEGLNGHTIRELLLPIEQTFKMCGMEYLPPYVIHGTHWMDEPDIAKQAERYNEYLSGLVTDGGASQ